MPLAEFIHPKNIVLKAIVSEWPQAGELNKGSSNVFRERGAKDMAIAKNVGRIEQVIRIVLGIILLFPAYHYSNKGEGWFLGLLGVFLIATALVSY